MALSFIRITRYVGLAGRYVRVISIMLRENIIETEQDEEGIRYFGRGRCCNPVIPNLPAVHGSYIF